MKHALPMVVGVVALACAAPISTPSNAPSLLASATATASVTAAPSPWSSGGVPEAEAVAIARGQATSTTTLVAASVARFFPATYVGPGFTIPPDELVWIVELTGEWTICGGPPQDVCQSPHPGFSTVYLDYFTGKFIGMVSYSPAN